MFSFSVGSSGKGRLSTSSSRRLYTDTSVWSLIFSSVVTRTVCLSKSSYFLRSSIVPCKFWLLIWLFWVLSVSFSEMTLPALLFACSRSFWRVSHFSWVSWAALTKCLLFLSCSFSSLISDSCVFSLSRRTETSSIFWNSLVPGGGTIYSQRFILKKVLCSESSLTILGSSFIGTSYS